MLSFGVARPCEVGRSTIGLVEVTAADRAAATLRRGGLSSVMRVAHDSSFCGRSQGGRVCGRGRGFRLCGGEAGAFRSPPPPLRPPTYKLVSNETLAGRGGSVSRRDLNRLARNRPHLSGGTKPEEVTQPERQPLFGREREGGASFREAASLAPRRSLALAGRGGSVSRRDLNRLARNRPHLSGGTNYAEATDSNASRSSGGSAREGLLSEKPPPSHTL